jgi:tRNA-intron lyase
MEFLEFYQKMKNNCEYAIYKDLKEKGFYITSGFKYGSEFLAYRDDPNFVHSEFIIYVVKHEDLIDVKKILQNERISVSNKKKLIMASVDQNSEIKYFNMEWIVI